MEIRQALHHLGEITGEITTDDLLDNPPAVGQVFSASSVLASRYSSHLLNSAYIL